MAITYTSVDVRDTIPAKRAVSKWIKAVVENEKKRLGGIAIALCSDNYILETNRQFLQHDYFTDVITFDYSEGDLLSGDILISVDTVKSNAQIFGVTFRQELLRVTIHGVLHLCGYKDKTDDEAKLMREKENYYLAYEI